VLFSGKYEHVIDEKQRLAVPAPIRARLDKETDGEAFYAAPMANGAIWLWTERVFERLAEDLEQSLMPQAELLEFDESLFPEAERLELDKAGRIRIPQEKLEEAGLGLTVVILGMRDHLELRDPAQYRESRRARAPLRREIMLRARQAMLQKRAGAGEQPP
jgi:MraZ protein